MSILIHINFSISICPKYDTFKLCSFESFLPKLSSSKLSGWSIYEVYQSLRNFRMIKHRIPQREDGRDVSN